MCITAESRLIRRLLCLLLNPVKILNYLQRQPYGRNRAWLLPKYAQPRLLITIHTTKCPVQKHCFPTLSSESKNGGNQSQFVNDPLSVAVFPLSTCTEVDSHMSKPIITRKELFRRSPRCFQAL